MNVLFGKVILILFAYVLVGQCLVAYMSWNVIGKIRRKMPEQQACQQFGAGPFWGYRKPLRWLRLNRNTFPTGIRLSVHILALLENSLWFAMFALFACYLYTTLA